MYYCLNERQRRREEPYFIYFPPGYKDSEIDEVYDTSSVWEQKVSSMMEHKSQVHDAEKILDRARKLPKQECFLVKQK
jgi:LmbE family N-acetylglucosaminyl deacetylase